MTFNSIAFLCFFSVVLIVTWAIGADRWRWRFLLAASAVFYGWWDYRFLALVAAVVAVGYLGGLAAGSGRPEKTRSRAVTLSVILLLALLCFFKYFDFFTQNLALLMPGSGWQSLNVILPVGISFFVFHAISYVVDVRQNRLDAEPSMTAFALYISFFPHMIAGPIVRATDFLPQLRAGWRPPTADEMAGYAARFLWGMFKKVFIADRLGHAIVDPVFANPTEASAALVIIAVLAFGIQIVADFSGYSDMAIATAGMLGIRFRENFLAPYTAASPQEFWRRWHVSLSSWIRDYVYIPLGGSRGGRVRVACNLLVALTLSGLWHGAAWTYVLWGTFHGAALVVNQAWRRAGWFQIPPLVGWILTMTTIFMAWALFRAADLGQLGQLMAAFGESRPMTFIPVGAMVFAGLCTLLILAEHVVLRWLETKESPGFLALPVPANIAWGIGIATFLLATDVPSLGVRNFVYFQF